MKGLIWSLLGVCAVEATSWHRQTFAKDGGRYKLNQAIELDHTKGYNMPTVNIGQTHINNISLFAGVPIAPLTNINSTPQESWTTAYAPTGNSTPTLYWSLTFNSSNVWDQSDRDTVFGPDLASYFPDGHTSTVPSLKNPGNWSHFYSLGSSYTISTQELFPVGFNATYPGTLITDPTLQDPLLVNSTAVSGGLWLMSVQRLSSGGYVGFVHQETLWKGVTGSPAWWTIRVAYSEDEGATWMIGDTILSTGPFPAEPQWGGDGNQGVVWDPLHQRYFCMYGGLSMAVSYDYLGRPGSWLKWDGSDFTVPGLNSNDAPINNLMTVQGANPSISFNTFLQLWLIFYQSDAKDIWAASSLDLVNWNQPQLILNQTTVSDTFVLSYATLSGELGDTVTGENCQLSFAAINATTGERVSYYIDVTFARL